MEDHVDNKAKNTEKEAVELAIKKIADTEAGVIFFRWLKKRCHFDRSTVSGNQNTYEVNTLGTISQEFQRTIYLQIRRAFNKQAQIKIEID